MTHVLPLVSTHMGPFKKQGFKDVESHHYTKDFVLRVLAAKKKKTQNIIISSY
jgi:hypothetical protein